MTAAATAAVRVNKCIEQSIYMFFHRISCHTSHTSAFHLLSALKVLRHLLFLLQKMLRVSASMFDDIVYSDTDAVLLVVDANVV